MRHRLLQLVVASSLSMQALHAQTSVPIAPDIRRVFAKGPDGTELFQVQSVVIERRTDGLWVQFGRREPPIRFQRTTGASKAIGRIGNGPDEYRYIVAMAPGAHGDVGIWDANRRSWFWTDSAGHQVRTWSLPTSYIAVGAAFTDLRGNAYVSQPRSLKGDAFVVVRIDSALGMRDTIGVPFTDDPKWRWDYKAASGGLYWSTARYAPSVLWTIDARGRMNAAWSDSSFVEVRDGTRTLRRALPDFRDPLTAGEKDSAKTFFDDFEARGIRQGAVFQNRRPAPARDRPQIAGIIPEMNGGIAIVRSRPCARVPDWRAPGSGAKATRGDSMCPYVERFDADGALLRPFTLNTGDRLKVLRGDTAWVVRGNADGLERVLELVVPK
jgi:hypothetical protein